jgi:hypothetical protein
VNHTLTITDIADGLYVFVDHLFDLADAKSSFADSKRDLENR